MAKRKKQTMSPTFKAGLILIIIMFAIWGVLTMQDPWYEKPIETKVETTEAPIGTATEKEENQVVEVEPTTEAPEQEETEEPVDEPEIPEPLVDTFDYSIDPESFVNDTLGWSFRRNTDHSPVEGYSQGIDLPFYDAFYRVDTDDKVVYLTFDEGYENGFSGKILDTLGEHSVQAAFFVTESYIRHNPELTKRMKDEGHIVANHSVNHPSMPSVTTEEMAQEIKGVETSMMEHTGYPIDMFFRPPMGEFSEKSLYVTRQQGYKTIFWSMAYVDWDVNNQPGKEAAFDHVLTNYHPGAIILLHAVSESNTEALGDIIIALREEGYRFGSLYEIPSYYQ